MREYKNYIFDLYGTLLDIKTNEWKASLWKLMADFYNVYGCRWSGRTFSKAFWAADAEEREILRKKMGFEYVEIKLERVFARMLFEVPGWYKCCEKIAGVFVDELRNRYETDAEEVLDIVTSSDWCVAVANLFRVHSRKLIHPYDNTVSTLRKLKEQGKGVYLLSNAQRIFTMPEIEMTGLNLLFDKMYISSDYGVMKPGKEFMDALLVGEKLNPDETVMVGNEFRSDITVAMRSGVDSIYLNTSSYTKDELDKEQKEVLEKENKSENDAPHIVMSGDIAEILK